jgi:hypothetical protein
LPEKMETPQVRRGHQNRELDPEEKLGKWSKEGVAGSPLLAVA